MGEFSDSQKYNFACITFASVKKMRDDGFSFLEYKSILAFFEKLSVKNCVDRCQKLLFASCLLRI